MIKQTLRLVLSGCLAMLSISSIAQTIQYEPGISDSIYSKTLNETRHLWVQLPEGYDPEASATRYPVVYVLDGSVHMQGLETVCNYYWGHHMPEMILIGISNRSNRTRDLTPSKVSWRNGGQVREESGGAENFIQFIEKELIPFVESKYKATSYRTLIGHSYGGLFTVHTLINHSHLFQNYIAIDPSLDWDGQKVMKQAKVALKEKRFQGKSLFVTLGAGQLHMLNEAVTMENVMQDTSEFSLFSRSIIEFSHFAENEKQSGLHFSWKHYPEDFHWTVALPSIRDGLIFQFKWYQLKHTQKFSDPATSLEELKRLIKTRESLLREHFGYPVPPFDEGLFNQAGYMYLQTGQAEKAFEFFKMALKYYPESANAYDSMADYYEAQNDLENALTNVKKAFELSGDVYYENRIKALQAMK